MKNKIRSVLLGAALVGCALFTSNVRAQYLDYVQGIWINGNATTNINVAGTNLAAGVINTAFTNTYNLGANLTQLNTNLWPAQALVNSYGNHNRFLFLSGTVAGALANTNGQEVVTLALSGGGQTNSAWVTNWLTFNIQYFGNTNVTWSTNIDTGGAPFVNLQSIGNTNTLEVITNTFAQPVSKLYN